MYPGVELRLYRYAVALAQELSFTRAARRLHVAQPNLTRQIRKLEQELGLKLFERTNRVVRLTPAGEAFVAEARLTLFHADRAVEGARAAKGQIKGPWTIGYSPLIDLHILPKIQQHLALKHPAADIRLASAHTTEQADRLMRGTIQAGLVILPVREKGLTTEGLYREPLILALPEQHALAAKPEIEITDLHELPLVILRGDIEPHFAEDLTRVFNVARIRPRIVNEATTQAEALELVSQGGLAALTMSSAQYPPRERIVFRRFADEFLGAETGLAYLVEDDSPILGSLRSFLFETFHPLGIDGGAGFRDGRVRQMKLF